MMQSPGFLIFIFAFLATVSAQTDKVENVTVGDTQYYEDNNITVKMWRYNFNPDLRGFFIYNADYPKLVANESLEVYRGNDTTKFGNRLFTFDESYVNSTHSQWTTYSNGEPLIFVYTPGTAANRPNIWMFMVSSINVTRLLSPSPTISGVFPYPNISQSFAKSINTSSDVYQIQHFIPLYNTIKLAFSLQSVDGAYDETNQFASLTLYRGDANDINDTSTIIKIYKTINDTDKVFHALGYGETLSLKFDYPLLKANDAYRGFSFLIGPIADNTTSIITPPPNDNTTNPSNPTLPGGSTTTGTTPTTTSSSPSLFALAPIIVTAIFHLCQTSLSAAH